MLRTHSFVFFAVHDTRGIFLHESLHLERVKTCFFIFFLTVQLSQPYKAYTLLQATLALSLVVSSLKSVGLYML